MRRTVATLLVVATALLMAVPVGASEEARPAGPGVLPAAPAVVELPAAAVPAPVTAAPAAPVVPAPTVAAPAAPPVARAAVKAVRARAPRLTTVNDAAYAARLQAELCRARQIFCGLDHGGRYPGH